jgi:5-oxopent-3-ene-1,2,5-tricarboxylate decarboxylase/2-hydroxyhepta-2,4-diene-1,7-dioate isomerase
MDVPPYGLSGTVYGALLNHRSALEELGTAVSEPPYGAAPRAPVLYVKPRNTLLSCGAPVIVPPGVAELEVGATVGVVIGRPACRLEEARALEHVAGYLIVNDVSIPHRPYYRPSIPQKARDGFCPLSAAVVPRARIDSPDRLGIRVFIDGRLRAIASTAELVRPVARLLAEVTDFMSLAPGDVLAVGVPAPAPRVRPGERVRIEIEGLGSLENPFLEAPP